MDPNVSGVSGTWTWCVMDRLTIIGRNPELADVSNPTGSVYGLMYDVVAEDRDGERRAYGRAYDTSDEAENLASFWNEHHCLPRLNCVRIDPAYGSAAYQRGGIEHKRLRDEIERAWD